MEDTQGRLPLERYAVNCSGWYIEHGIEERVPFQQVTAKGNKISSVRCETIFQNREEDQILRAHTEPHENELEDIRRPKETSKFLVVGVACRPDLKKELAEPIHGMDINAECRPRKGSKGYDEPTEEQLCRGSEWDMEVGRLLPVVTPIRLSDQVALGALLCPDDYSICTPYSIPKSDVFYFAEYRTPVGGRQNREGEWSEMIKQHIAKILSDDKSTSITGGSRAPKYIRRKGLAPLRLEPELSLIHELSFLMKVYESAEGDSQMQCLEDIIGLMEDKGGVSRLPGLDGYQAFVDLSESFGEVEAEAMANDLAHRWPDVENVTALRLQQLRRGMVQAELDLEEDDKYLKGFLNGGMHELRKLGVDDLNSYDFAGLAKEVLENAKRYNSSGLMPSVTEQDDFASFVVAVREKLRAIANANQDLNREIIKQHGDVATLHSVEDIYQAYARSCDADEQRRAFGAALRYQEATRALAEVRTSDEVRDVLEIMDRMEL